MFQKYRIGNRLFQNVNLRMLDHHDKCKILKCAVVTDIYTLPCVEEIASGNLLYSSGSLALGSGMT